MSQKQARFNINRHGEELHKPRRPIFFSSDDLQRMADERSRRKLIRQLVSKPPEPSGEFSSYYCGPKKQNDPVYSLTTHTIKEDEMPHGFVVPTYCTSINNVRWDPNTEATQEPTIYSCHNNERQNMEESTNFNCRCKQCTGKHCRGQLEGENKYRIFRDNIKTFADISTMTPVLYDACCGSCTPEIMSGKTSDVSISSSDIAARASKQHPFSRISQAYSNCDPVSILKKERYESTKDYELEEDKNYYIQKEKKCRIADDFQEAVRDTEDDVYYERDNSKPMRSFPKVVRNKNHAHSFDDSEPRKNLYNEGISDLTMNLLPTAPVYPERFQSPKTLNSGYNRTSFNSFPNNNGNQSREEVPFSHHSGSRCPYSYATPQAKPYYFSNDLNEHQNCTKKFRRTYSSKQTPYYSTDSVKFPRKVLTSERDIESYIGARFTKASNR